MITRSKSGHGDQASKAGSKGEDGGGDEEKGQTVMIRGTPYVSSLIIGRRKQTKPRATAEGTPGEEGGEKQKRKERAKKQKDPEEGKSEAPGGVTIQHLVPPSASHTSVKKKRRKRRFTSGKGSPVLKKQRTSPASAEKVGKGHEELEAKHKRKRKKRRRKHASEEPEESESDGGSDSESSGSDQDSSSVSEAKPHSKHKKRRKSKRRKRAKRASKSDSSSLVDITSVSDVSSPPSSLPSSPLMMNDWEASAMTTDKNGKPRPFFYDSERGAFCYKEDDAERERRIEKEKRETEIIRAINRKRREEMEKIAKMRQSAVREKKQRKKQVALARSGREREKILAAWSASVSESESESEYELEREGTPVHLPRDKGKEKVDVGPLNSAAEALMALDRGVVGKPPEVGGLLPPAFPHLEGYPESRHPGLRKWKKAATHVALAYYIWYMQRYECMKLFHPENQAYVKQYLLPYSLDPTLEGRILRKRAGLRNADRESGRIPILPTPAAPGINGTPIAFVAPTPPSGLHPSPAPALSPSAITLSLPKPASSASTVPIASNAVLAATSATSPSVTAQASPSSTTSASTASPSPIALKQPLLTPQLLYYPLPTAMAPLTQQQLAQIQLQLQLLQRAGQLPAQFGVTAQQLATLQMQQQQLQTKNQQAAAGVKLQPTQQVPGQIQILPFLPLTQPMVQPQPQTSQPQPQLQLQPQKKASNVPVNQQKMEFTYVLSKNTLVPQPSPYSGKNGKGAKPATAPKPAPLTTTTTTASSTNNTPPAKPTTTATTSPTTLTPLGQTPISFIQHKMIPTSKATLVTTPTPITTTFTTTTPDSFLNPAVTPAKSRAATEKKSPATKGTETVPLVSTIEGNNGVQEANNAAPTGAPSDGTEPAEAPTVQTPPEDAGPINVAASPSIATAPSLVVPAANISHAATLEGMTSSFTVKVPNQKKKKKKKKRKKTPTNP